jgi:DNA helicase II / ATP-dependent DNA helicase PcrA
MQDRRARAPVSMGPQAAPNPGPASRAPTAEELSISADEERLLASVRAAVAGVKHQPRHAARATAAEALASLREEYAVAGEEDRPAVLAQMHEEAARDQATAARLLPDLDAPYFGHLRVRSHGRVRDVLIGACAFLDPARGVTVVDWRKSPIAEVFFSAAPGDDYEIEVEGRVVEGVVERRHVVAFDRGEIAVIEVAGGALVRGSSGFRFEPEGLAPRLADTGEPPIAARGGPRVAALLDREQLALLGRDPAEPLLVLGSAGSGKTTVALHRVAMLTAGQPARFDPRRVLVVVPEPGLRRFAERLLADLSVERVAVRTFDGWIRAEARRAFPGMPQREAPETPPAVSRMKRHPAMLAAVDRLVEALAGEMAERIDRRLDARGEVCAAFAERAEPILAERLQRAEACLGERATAARRRAIAEACGEEEARLASVLGDHLRLVGDRAILQEAVRASGGDLPGSLVDELAIHTRRQIDVPSEVRFAHVSRARLVALDGRALDDGTPDEAAGTVDVEDYALLFELLWRKTGKLETRAGGLSRYAHVVVDEAQELAPIELRALGRAVEGSVTVAGDAAQRIDRTGHFASWEAVMEALGTRAAPAYLTTSYRCPRPIVDFAHAVLGPEAPDVTPSTLRDGAPVLSTVVPSEAHAALAIVQALNDLQRRAPGVSVAVLARDADAARAVHEVVSRVLPARLVRDGDFSFGPGVEVTEVAEAKGLEFDYVIVPDASARHYPSTPAQRRTLHVAVTRAARQAWLISPGAPSPILPPGVG